MRQTSLFGVSELDAVVNVASVPQRSPFRYPGGKTWLVPRIRQWLTSLAHQPAVFVEPFAGGGIMSLTVAFERLAEHVVMSELDEQVAAVWQTILQGDATWLADRIATFPFSADNVAEVVSTHPQSIQELAFQTILRNRVNRGGILAQGAGMLKTGEGGRGLASRWYPETLKRRILSIAAIRDRITFIAGDGLTVMQQYACHLGAVFFIDPPYTAAGKKAGSRLYTHSRLDHAALFQLAADIAGDLLLTYDDTEEIQALALHYGLTSRLVAMKSTHHAKMTERLIGKSLDWL